MNSNSQDIKRQITPHLQKIAKLSLLVDQNLQYQWQKKLEHNA